MIRVLSFGGGVQTTALAILAAEGKVKADVAVFADTGAEKPETYWYLENYTKPLLEKAGIEFVTVRNERPLYQPDLYGFLWRIKEIPGIIKRRCTDHFKLRPIKKWVGKQEVEMMVGFSLDEAYRAERPRHLWACESYPLIQQQMTVTDCRQVIKDFGWPLPVKSSCFFCQFTTPFEWQWLKTTHPDLFKKALDLEANYHERRPEHKTNFGLYRGTPLWRLAAGKQMTMGLTLEQSCWSGACGH